MLKMKMLLSLGVTSAFLALIVSCVQQGGGRSANVKAPVPTASMAKASGKSLDHVGKGYVLFQSHCAQCHELKMPKDMRVNEWHTIVPGMAWNAGLKKEDEQAVMSYLVAATKQLSSVKNGDSVSQ